MSRPDINNLLTILKIFKSKVSDMITVNNSTLESSLNKKVDDNNADLSAKITANNSTLESNLDKKISDSLVITEYTKKIVNAGNSTSFYTTSLNKAGRTVTFVINITTKAISSFTVEIGTLPEECRPKSDVCLNTVSNKGKTCYIYVNATGKFGFTKCTETSWELNDGIRQTFSFISAK